MIVHEFVAVAACPLSHKPFTRNSLCTRDKQTTKEIIIAITPLQYFLIKWIITSPARSPVIPCKKGVMNGKNEQRAGIEPVRYELINTRILLHYLCQVN